MSVSQTDIIRGPAIIQYGAASSYSRDDISVTIRKQLFDINTSMHGRVDQRLEEVVTEVSFTPAGRWANLATLFPHATPNIGGSIFSDTDLVVHSVAGQKLTLHNAALTQMPEITLSAVAPLLGSVTFAAIGADNTDWDDAAKRATIASEALTAPAFDPADVLTQPYAVSWGASSPWDSIETEAGTVISFALNLEPVTTDSDGIVDMTLASLEVSARFKPVGVTEAEIAALLKIQGAGVKRGGSLLANSQTLTCTGTGVQVDVFGASPVEGPLMYGQATLRAGEVQMQAMRTFSAGVAQPLFAVGTGA